jgi:hypothetical protein
LLKIEGNIISSGEPDSYGIGADDRAGCAMLWALKDLGHHLLITDGEECGCLGTHFLLDEYKDIADIINNSVFMLEFDRRISRKGTKYHYTAYGTSAGTEFCEFIESNTGYVDDDRGGHTDIVELCKTVSGANIGVGYSGAHSNSETIDTDVWRHTYEIFGRLLSKPLVRFPLN